MSPSSLTEDEQRNAVKTWLYLRLAMPVLVAGLGVSVVAERLSVPGDCFQRSISAYYYTPVQGYFVAVLLGIGVCLFCLKGSTDVEDGLLNLAGMFAPMVAFVPTPDPGGCRVAPKMEPDLGPSIANNVTALLVIGTIALALVAVTTVRRSPPLRAWFGYGAAAVVWIAFAMAFLAERDTFTKVAHYAAAVPMFICICAVVCVNAWGLRTESHALSWRNAYIAIAAAMLLSSVVVGIAALSGWSHAVLAIEVALITLFAIFWLIQTWELRSQGLR